MHSKGICFPDSCLYHPGAPYFHDAYKIWSCCNQKSTDFSTWLSLKGCTRGQHSNHKSVVETNPEKLETTIKTQKPEEVSSGGILLSSKKLLSWRTDFATATV